MSTELAPTPAAGPVPIATIAPPRRDARGKGGTWGALIVASLAVVGLGLWGSGVFSKKARSHPGLVETVDVDRGDLVVDIVESGTLESTNNATVRCQVEALIGTVGGQTSGKGGNRGSGGGSGGTTVKANTGGVAGAAGFGSASKTGAAGAKAVGAAKASTASSKVSSASTVTTAAAAAPIDPNAAAMGAVQPLKAPTVTSFSYKVTPHVPLRPKSTAAPKAKSQPMQQMGGFGGNSGMEEQRGSTRILWILAEGTPVREGDVVCKLDSASFEDEIMAQQIRHDQAKAWVDQARSLLEVNEISLREYKEGTLPKDRDLIAGYIETTGLELGRAQTALQWSKEAFQKGFRTEPQLKSDELALDRAKVQSKESQTMRRRLEEFTAPRLLRNLEAKSAAIRADLLAQEQALKVEVDRLKRLEKIIENCTMVAPRDGLVVYANQSSGWGRQETQIREGVTVRERQPIFNLPDPARMSVRTRVNESKIASIYIGQKANVLIDAFPDTPMDGTVKEVTVIPAPANGPIADVKIYMAVVELDAGGFEGLRPGLSAQVTFHVEDLEDVVRVPVGALRWVNSRPWVARETSSGDLEWIRLTLGKVGPNYAEVVEGLEPGDRVAAAPAALPGLSPEAAKQADRAEADADADPDA